MSKFKEYFDKIKMLVENGGDVNSVMCGNSLAGNLVQLYYLDKLNDGKNIIKKELEERKDNIFEMLEWLRSNGADLNKGESPPLMFAVEEFDAPMTKYLLSHGANVCTKINNYTGNNWCMEHIADALVNSDEFSKNEIYEVVRLLKYYKGINA